MEELVRLIRERVKNAPQGRPNLRVVGATPADPGMDTTARRAHVRRIRWMARAFRLQWLVDQETWEVGAVDRLDDAALVALLRDMERARECLQDGVSLEDAGLLRRVCR